MVFSCLLLGRGRQVINKNIGGVFLDSSGRVRALWSSYSFYSWASGKNYESFHATGIDLVVDVVTALVPVLRAGGAVDGAIAGMPRSLECALKRMPLSSAVTNLGLPSEWVAKLVGANKGRSQVLSVAQLLRGHAASACLREGDLILAVDGAPVCTFRDVELAVGDRASVGLTVLRDESLQVLKEVPTAAIDGVGTARVLIWAGLVLQAPHRGAREMGPVASEVYISSYFSGSPAGFYDVPSAHFLTRVGPTKVRTLDDVAAAVGGLRDGEAVQVRLVDLQGQATSASLKVDYHYWPTVNLVRCSRKQTWESSKP